MSKILNEAVYLLNPAGSVIAYKEDSLNSVLPNDGTGDYTWVGGQGGTRVNQDGYIERTPANLHLKSNDFNQSPWSKTGGTTLTSGQSDPFGGNNAWKVEMTSGANNFLYAYSNPRVLGIVTISAYLRADTTTTIGFNDGAANPNSVTIGTTWQRYTFTYDVNAGGPYSIIQLDNYFGLSPTQQTKTFYLYGAQLVEGSIPKPYQPTTDRLNYPRIDFSKGKGALLLEKQATNHLLYSEDLTNSEWSKSNISITIPGDVMSPDGTLNANKVARGGTSSTYFWQEGTRTSSDRFNSLFFKAGTTNQVTCLGNSYSSGTYATFDLSTGTVVNSAGCAPFIIKNKNGWYRCGIKQTNGVSYPSLWTLNGYTNETVVSGEYIYAWGGQSERVANNTRELPSSYIPTQASSVTRATDEGETSGTSNLPTGNSPRTLFTEFEYDGVEDTSVTSGLYSWISGYGQTVADKLFAYIVTSNNTPFFFGYSNDKNFTGTTLEKNKRYRFAITYNGTIVDFFINGSSIGTYTPPSPFNTTNQDLYQNQRPDGNFNSQKLIFTEAVFPRHLSTTEAQDLTSFRSGSGGEITNYGPYSIHTFTSSGTFTPSFSGEVEVLVVAGGGAGGSNHDTSTSTGAGGGGAGGVFYLSSFAVSAGTGVTVTIGAGGTISGAYSTGKGGNSSFGGFESIGGGNGGARWVKGSDGGSGGGQGFEIGIGNGVDGQGNSGGNGRGNSTYGYPAGGGGGAGEVGANQDGANGAGKGGDGLPFSITGFSTYYGGGGGGGVGVGASPTTPGDGGKGGGAQGAIQGVNPAPSGTPNTGGGGGGGSNGGYSGGSGGSGIVIVRYLT